MNQLKCPGCGAIICDFVIYCPECGFAVKDYFDQQTAALTAGFFADVVPAATETASASVSAEKKETKSRPHNGVKPLQILYQRKRILVYVYYH